MTARNFIRISIADGNAIFRQGLQVVLDQQSDMKVVASVATASEVVAAFATLHPDVTILDLRMPETECLNAIRAIRAANPQARIVILTNYDGDEDIVRGLRAGASGYLLKDATPAEVVETVHAVHAGKKRVDREIAAKLAERSSSDELSPSELAILREMAEGKSNPQIAAALTLSEGTVKFHVNNILLKLDVSNRTEAVVTAVKRGLVRIS